MKQVDSADARSLIEGQATALAMLGHRYYLHGMYAESAKLFEFILRHEPARSEHYFALGKALHALKWHDKAINAYTRAIRLGQADAELHFYMGQCLLFMDRMDEAGHSLENCLRLSGRQNPSDSPLMQKAKQLLMLVHRHKKKLAAQVIPSPTMTEPLANPTT
jgi:tetratricopeptide (TPR) repeat protein